MEGGHPASRVLNFSHGLPSKDDAATAAFYTASGAFHAPEDATHIDYQYKAGGLFCMVCDGHCGWTAAAHVASALPAMVAHAISKVVGSAMPEEQEHDVQGAFLRAFHEADAQCNDIGHGAGTTAAVVWLRAGGRYTAAWAGDTAVLCVHGDGRSEWISTLHRVSNSGEKLRLQQEACPVEIGRVRGISAVTRSLGDSGIHPAVVSTPEVVHGCVHGVAAFLVLSDGVHDVLSKDQIGDLALSALQVDDAHLPTLNDQVCARQGVSATAVQGADASTRLAVVIAKRVADAAVEAGSLDDVTAVAVLPPALPTHALA